jgi:hypothetical protein
MAEDRWAKVVLLYAFFVLSCFLFLAMPSVILYDFIFADWLLLAVLQGLQKKEGTVGFAGVRPP